MSLRSLFHSKIIRSLSGWLQVGTAVYLSAALLLAWISKQTPEWLGPLTWPKAILIGLLAASALLFLLAVSAGLAAHAYRQFRPKGPSTGGDTFSAHGTVRDVPPSEQLARGLYVGRIEIDVSRLQADHVVELVIFGFNGTNNIVSYSRATGSIAVSISGNPTVAFQLSPPSVLAHRSNPDSFSDYTEFLLVFEQSLKPDAVGWLSEQIRGHRVLFDLDELDIIMEVRGEGVYARLPIWNGATVYWHEGYKTSAHHKLQVNDVITGSPSL